MKGFRFRLDSLHRVRNAQLDVRQAELERARRRLGADSQAAEAAEERARAADDSLVRTLSAGIAGNGLRAALEARLLLGRAASSAAQAAEEAASEAEAAQTELTKAWRRTRSLETLRERALILWRGEQGRREQREDDERAVRRRHVLPLLLAMSLSLVVASNVVQAEEAEPGAPPVSGELAEETLRRILGELRVREKALEQRERDVAQRERVVEELSADAKQLLVELDAVRAEIEQRVGSSDAESSARIGRLAKTYAEMAPAQAAPLLEGLDAMLATEIVSKMKPKDSAAILAQMSRETALRMSEITANPLDEPSTRRTP